MNYEETIKELETRINKIENELKIKTIQLNKLRAQHGEPHVELPANLRCPPKHPPVQ